MNVYVIFEGEQCGERSIYGIFFKRVDAIKKVIKIKSDSNNEWTRQKDYYKKWERESGVNEDIWYSGREFISIEKWTVK